MRDSSTLSLSLSLALSVLARMLTVFLSIAHTPHVLCGGHPYLVIFLDLDIDL